MSIAENLALVSRSVEQALRRRQKCGAGEKVKIVAVTKNQDIAKIREAVEAGAVAVGENRVQEALTKHAQLGPLAEWHLIGHLQTNKVRQVLPLCDLIHSVDSERLAAEIDRVAGRIGKRQDVLLQVNVAGEDSKFGIAPSELEAMATMLSKLENVRLCGLMTIAPFYEEAEAARPVFKELYRMFTALKAAELPGTAVEWLSMGMTNDYTVAVEEGANLVRIGTAIFGPRHYKEGGTAR